MTESDTASLAEMLLRGAAAHPDRDCMVLVDERATYGELAARARRAARSLLALGVERGDRVGILMANCLDYTDILFGASLIGAVPVMYNARFKAREIAHVTTDAGVKVVVTNDIVEQHTDYVELLEEGRGLRGAHCWRRRCSSVREPETASSAATTSMRWPTRSNPTTSSATRETKVTDTAIMFYTSGTTAMPKGCPLDHIVLQHAGVVGGADRFGMVEGDVMWGPLPMFHSAFTQPLPALCTSAARTCR